MSTKPSKREAEDGGGSDSEWTPEAPAPKRGKREVRARGGGGGGERKRGRGKKGVGSAKKKRKLSKEEKAAKKKRSEKYKRNNATKEANSKAATEKIFAGASIEELEKENYVYELTKGFTCVLNKKLWDLLIEKHAWDQRLVGRSKESRLHPKPIVIYGTLQKTDGEGNPRSVGALVSELIISKLSKQHRGRAEKIGFVINGSKGAVAEHDTGCKVSFSREHVSKIVMQKLNVFFKVKHPKGAAAKTSIYPGVCWHKQRKKWYTQVRNPATGKQDVTGGYTDCEAIARARAFAKYDKYYNKPECARFRTYIEIYDEQGEIKPRLITVKKMSVLMKRMRAGL